MKKILILLCLTGLMISCKNEQEPKAPVSPEAPQAAGQPMSREELDKQKELAQKEGLASSESDIVGTGKGQIIGKNVAMKSDATFSSDNKGTFDENEMVKMITYKVVQSEGEGILGKPVSMRGAGGTITLAKGKTVNILQSDASSNIFLISYDDPKKGKFGAEVKADVFETRIFATWHQVQRQNGETVWVLGKYLQQTK